MKNRFVSRAAKCALLFVTLAVLLSVCQSCLFSYQDHNTHRIRSFYDEEKDSLDVVFIGASEVFTGFSPGLAYEACGMTSYMYAMESNQGSLYKAQLKEILAHQSPSVIYVDVFGFLRSNESALYEEARLRMFAENIPFSLNKLQTILEHPYEDKLSCLLPFVKYHGDLTVARSRVAYAVKRLLAPDIPMDLKGMMSNAAIWSGPGDPGSDDPQTFHIAPACEAYLRDFLAFLEEEELENVVFVNFPRYLENADAHSLTSCISDVEGVIAEHGFPFLNLQEKMDEIGIDTAHDFYNTHHLNVYGQRKVTDYFIRVTQDIPGFSPRAQSEQNRLRWEEAAACAQEFSALLDRAILSGDPIWVDQLSDEWLFRRQAD